MDKLHENVANVVANRIDTYNHHVQGEAAKDRAMDPNRGIVERVEAGGHAISEKTKESVSDAKAQHFTEQLNHVHGKYQPLTTELADQHAEVYPTASEHA